VPIALIFFGPLSEWGWKLAFALGAGGFLITVALGFLPIRRSIRTLCAAVGPVAAVVFFIVQDPHGLNALAWFMILGIGVTDWFTGFILIIDAACESGAIGD
jgi:hypothetical protein